LKPLFNEHQLNIDNFISEFVRFCGPDTSIDSLNMTTAVTASYAINSESININDSTGNEYNQSNSLKAELYSIATCPQKKSPTTRYDENQSLSPTDSSSAFRDAFYSGSPNSLHSACYNGPSSNLFADSGLINRSIPNELELTTASCYVTNSIINGSSFSKYAYFSTDDENDSCVEDAECNDYNENVVVGAAVRRKRSPCVELDDEDVIKVRRPRLGDWESCENQFQVLHYDVIDDASGNCNVPRRGLLDFDLKATYDLELTDDDNETSVNLSQESIIHTKLLTDSPPSSKYATERDVRIFDDAYSTEFTNILPDQNHIPISNNLNNDFVKPRSSYSATYPKSTTKFKTIKLHKDLLQQFSTVAQWDKKFVLATFPDSKSTNSHARLLLLFDQHALDERLNYENYEAQVSSTSHLVTRKLSTSDAYSSIEVGEEDIQFIHQSTAALNTWHFHFFTSSPSSSISSGKNEFTIHKTFVVTLQEAPQILGETLTIHDFMEFVHFLKKQSHMLPISALKPPAANRILASRSCHSSVKFGDELSRNYCDDMLHRLQSTSFPFQCAHGRPSAVPLIEYIDESRSSRCRNKPNYSNIFNELSALGLVISDV